MNVRNLLVISSIILQSISLASISHGNDLPILIEQLKTAEWPNVKDAANALKGSGEEAVGPLIEAMASDRIWVTILTPETLAAIGEPAVEPLIDALKNENWRIREGTAKALGLIGDKRAIKPLIFALNDQFWYVRTDVIHAIGSIDGKEAMDKLLYILNDKSDHMLVRNAAANELKNPQAFESLCNVLADSQEHLWLRTSAASSLGAIGDGKAYEYLVAAMREDYPDVDKVIEEVSLAYKGAPFSFSYNKEDEKVSLREAAILALGRINHTGVVEEIGTFAADNNIKIRKAVIDALKNQGTPECIPVLVIALNDYNTGIKAAEILDTLGWNPASVEERIHYWVAKRRGQELRDNWEATKRVLLKDIDTEQLLAQRNAVYAFIGIGRDDAIDELVKKIQTGGSKRLAEIYYNTGHKKLRYAAQRWATLNGYVFQAGEGSSVGTWGGW